MGREVWLATAHGFAKIESLALHFVIILEFRKIYSSQKEEQREAKGKGEKERYTHLNAEFQEIPRRDKKAFLSNQCKEIEENNRMEKMRDVFKKIRDTKEAFHAKLVQ